MLFNSRTHRRPPAADCGGRLRESGQDVDTALANASRDRLRPILMTALATVAGMIPLALAVGAGSQIDRKSVV